MTNADSPAFATPETDTSYGHYGLTKREHFAGLAMAGLLAAAEESPAHTIAAISVSHADALLAELGMEQTK